MEWDLDGNNEDELVDAGEVEDDQVVVERKSNVVQPSKKKEEDMFVLERVQWR